MGDRTSIEWCDATWNPVRGCSRVSEGCRHCYAESVAARFSGPGMPYEGLAKRVGGEARWTGKVRLVPEHLGDPLRWKKPRRIFVNSMSDLFHEGLSFEEIAAVFAVMALAPRHTFQVLTKRPRRALEFFSWLAEDRERLDRAALEHFGDEAECWEHNYVNGWSKPAGIADDGNPCNGTVRRWPLPNVWHGVSVEDQATADERIPLLLQCPAAVRFVSYEPALAPVDFTRLPLTTPHLCPGAIALNALTGGGQIPRLDQVIVGGESGPGARPFVVAWARETVRQCREAGVACFVKQLGARPICEVGSMPLGTGRGSYVAGGYMPTLADRKGGDSSEWPEDLRVREFPA